MDMQKEEMENKTYEFIGRLALVLFSQNIKMSYDTLAALLKDNGLDNYAGGRGMAAGVSAASSLGGERKGVSHPCHLWGNCEYVCR